MEDATPFLAKVIGLALMAIGAVIVVRRRKLVPVFATYIEQRLLRFIISMIELVGGLGLVVNNAWSPFAAALVTLIGWLAVAEALFFMAAPDALVAWLMRNFNTEGWYVAGGTVAFVVGFYLAGSGLTWSP
jgi:uncharacterized membrane protein